MGIAERKAREKMLRHEQILEAAYDVFHEVGFFAATMDLIAERAELAKGTIYLYFKSKEELYCSLLINGLDILIGLLGKMVEKRPPPERLLKETASTLIQFYTQYTDYFRIFMMLQHEELQAKVSPELSIQINERAATILKLLSVEIESSMDAGVFTRRNPWHVATILWGAFSGITQLALTKEQLKARAGHIDDMLFLCFDLIQRGLFATNPAESATPGANQEAHDA